MDTEEHEWIQQALINYERNRCISKLFSVQGEDAIAKGNNYNSDIVRIKMKVVLNSGELEERSVILKLMPKTEHRRKTLKSMGTNVTEARMFSELLPKIEKYRLLKEKCSEPLIPICYGIRNFNEDFLLEDLQAQGFELSNRYLGIDYDHLVLAAKTLAKFHAIGAVLIEQGEIQPRDYDTNMLLHRKAEMGGMFQSCYQELADEIETSWDAEWQPYVEKLRKFSKCVTDVIIEGLENDCTQFKTINHGDYWLTNMLFRHDIDGKPNSIRMLDFQLSSYISPIVDVQYFLNTSPTEDALDKKKEIFRIYSNHLLQYLETYGYKGKKPTIEELDKRFELTKPYGLTIALVFRPFMMKREEQVVDMEEFTKKFQEKEKLKLCDYKNIDETCLNMLKKNLKEGLECGVL